MDVATMPVYEAIARDIKSLGVEQVFGLISDDTILLVATLDGMGVKFRGARHESNAVAMAAGYACATGKLGIAIVGRGAGTTNALHGATYVQRSGDRVLLILGDAPNSLGELNGVGPDAKTFNVSGVLQAMGIRAFSTTESIAVRRTLARAVAATERGVTALLLPNNIHLGQLDFTAAEPEARPVSKPATKPAHTAAIQTAADLLRKSRKPLFVAGIGAYRAGAREAIIRLADHVGAALSNTLKSQGMFRGHPFDCGTVGAFSHKGGRRLIDQADCVVVFGASLNLRTTNYGTTFPEDAPLIQVDTTRTNIGRWYSADVAIVADARQVAEQLLESLPARPQSDKLLHSMELRQWLSEFDIANEFEPASTPRTMDPRSVGVELDRMLPRDRNAVYDLGNHLQIAAYISVLDPSHVKHSTDFTSMGMGFGTALGYACGMPERTTVLFVGDGGFIIAMSELETVVREDIPLVIVVMNDCAYGVELHNLRLSNMPTTIAKFPDVDFAPMAEALGFQVATVRTIEELRELEPMLSKPEGPILLDCKINGDIHAAPMAESFAWKHRKKG